MLLVWIIIKSYETSNFTVGPLIFTRYVVWNKQDIKQCVCSQNKQNGAFRPGVGDGSGGAPHHTGETPPSSQVTLHTHRHTHLYLVLYDLETLTKNIQM